MINSPKQERSMVRTAQDLERKYNFGDFDSIKKNQELSAEGINKINKELDNFINATTQNITDIKNDLDGKVNTYYYNGVPSLTTEPTLSWKPTEYDKHINDLYYDKDTGHVYIFQNNNGVYSWDRIDNEDIIKSLALANSAQDVADSKRRVFLSQPVPPYDNGDLWLNNEELYVCQISKQTGEVYAENDFIIATKYTDDTLAHQLGNDLTVVKGQVLKIQEGHDNLTLTFIETNKLVNSTTDQLAQEISERKAIIRATQENGVPVVELGASESPIKTKYKNDGMYIYDNGNVTSYFKNGMAYNHDMKVLNSLGIGEFAWIPNTNGGLDLVYLGGEQ